MGTARAPVFGSGRWPACTWRVSNPKARGTSVRGRWSMCGSLTKGTLQPSRGLRCKKLLDHRCLPCLLEQEAIVTVRGVDDVTLDRLAEGVERVGNRLRT